MHQFIRVNKGTSLKSGTVLRTDKAYFGVDNFRAISREGVFAKGFQLLLDLSARFGAVGGMVLKVPKCRTLSHAAVGKSGRKSSAH